MIVNHKLDKSFSTRTNPSRSQWLTGWNLLKLLHCLYLYFWRGQGRAFCCCWGDWYFCKHFCNKCRRFWPLVNDLYILSDFDRACLVIGGCYCEFLLHCVGMCKIVCSWLLVIAVFWTVFVILFLIDGSDFGAVYDRCWQLCLHSVLSDDWLFCCLAVWPHIGIRVSYYISSGYCS